MNGAARALTLDGAAQRGVFALVVAAAAIVPLESFLITLMAKTGTVPDRLLFAGQFAIEGMVYLALAAVVFWRVTAGLGWRRTPADLPLLVILAIATLATAVNDAPLEGSAMNLRSMLRYAAVFYLVCQAGLTRRQVGAVLWVILLSGAVQVGVGMLQWLVGNDLKTWMLPYTSDIQVAGRGRRFAIVERGRELGSLSGTLGDTLYYGLFLGVALTVALLRVTRWRRWHVVDLFMLGLAVAYSYSRAAVIVTGLTLVSYAGTRLGPRRVAAACCLVAGLGLAGVGASLVLETHDATYHHPRHSRRSILSNMTNIFSAEYLERSKRQRLGAVLGVAPTALMGSPVLGYGPDQWHAIRQLNEAEPSRLYKTLTKEGFEDVYWVALLCYGGVAGVVSVLWLGVRLLWTCAAVARGARGDPLLRWAGLCGACIVAQAAVLMWFNRVPEIRSFSFYLWLLPALAYAAWAADRVSDTVHTRATETS